MSAIIHVKYGRKIRYQSVDLWRYHAVNEAQDTRDFCDFSTVVSQSFWLKKSLNTIPMLEKRF